MKLSEHFSLEEFEHSDTAIRYDIENKAPDFVINNLKELCENVLEPLRSRLDMPIKILSGFRCHELNSAVGGVNNSQHLTGNASDITIEGMTHPDLFKFIRDNLSFDQLILEHVKENNPNSGWVHVSWNGDRNRNQCLKIG